MSEHTEGPWIATVEILDRGGWESPRQWVTIDSNDCIIAYYDTAAMEYPATNEENEANARLIAAAPDLSKELKESTNCLIVVSGFGTLQSNMIQAIDEQIKRNKAAIAKVEKGK